MTWTQAIPTHVADSDFQADHAVMAVTVDRVSGRTAFVRHAKSPDLSTTACFCAAESAARLVAAFYAPGMEYFSPQLEVFNRSLLPRLKRLF
jgi:hypothetical protein